MTILCRHFGFIITLCSAASLMHHEYLQNPLPSPFLISWKVRMLIISVQVYFCRSASKILLLIHEHHLSIINILPSWRWEINIYLISQISSSNWILKHLFKHQSFWKILYYAYNINYLFAEHHDHSFPELLVLFLPTLSLSLSLSSLMLASCFKFHINFLDTLWFLHVFLFFFILSKQAGMIKPNKINLLSYQGVYVKSNYCILKS